MIPQIIGLTGQTGAGKSTVSQALREAGFAVIDCDRLAHQVLEDRENDIRLLTRFSYDRGGNLIQVVQQGREGQRELSCTYDLKDRLTGVKELGGPVFGYGYDRNDNRIQQKRRLPLAQEAYAVTRYHYDLRGTWWARKKGEACGQNTPMMLPATGPKAGMGTG